MFKWSSRSPSSALQVQVSSECEDAWTRCPSGVVVGIDGYHVNQCGQMVLYGHTLRDHGVFR